MQTPHPTRSRAGLLTAVAVSVAAGSLAAQAAGFPTVEAKDKIKNLAGAVLGGALYTDDAGGHSGKPGDYAIDFSPRSTGPVHVKDISFLNAETATDELTISLWVKKYDTADSSAFWLNSPSSNNGLRGFQAHVPWSNNNIYFDTSGCCGADTQRINAGIDTFSGYTGDATWWTDSWHHFVFSKKGETKQVWIDGQLFLEGINTMPLPTDFTEMFIGAATATTSQMHGLIDDFAIYGTALPEASITKLAAGTAPSALGAADQLLVYWDFNDPPADGVFVSVSPTPGATGAPPDGVRIVHLDGAAAWDANNVTLKIDGQTVLPTFVRDGKRVTLTWKPSTLFRAQSRHTGSLTYPAAGGSATSDWSWEVAPFTADSVASYVGAFTGGSAYTDDAGGRTAKAGDYAVDFSRVNTGPVIVGDASFLNNTSKDDVMTVAFWQKKYDTVDGSAFWINAPSSGGSRAFQVHAPWSNNNIYFDTAGCCGADIERINGDIANFAGYSGDRAWWNDWHFLVFSKNKENKQIWVDGELFLEGVNTDPLPTDITNLYLGSDGAGGGRMHGVLDDFMIFGTALNEATVKQLYQGAVPTSLPASHKLVAYWNFNDLPPGGLFTSFFPANGAVGAAPNLVRVRHKDGSAPWDLTKVSLSIDGSPVAASVTRDGSLVTVSYVPNPIFAPMTKHTAVISYPDGGSTGSYSWEFTVGNYTKDSLKGYIGVLEGPAKYSADAAGATGKAGDFAIDLGTANARQAVHVLDGSFLNTATASDELSFSIWQKLYSVTDQALIWAISPSSSGTQRGFSIHSPWSNNNLYFDTAGCCDAATQRINAPIADFPGYTDATWWQTWRHIVAQKKGSTKEIWIDGVLFLTGDNTSALPTDFTEIYLGFDPPDNATVRGLIDDFAVFKTALVESDIVALSKGTLPSALPASKGLMAYWNFNDVPAAPVVAPKFSVTRAGNSVTVTSDPQPLPAGFVLETATSVTGPWTVQAGGNTPITVPVGAGNVFLRAIKR